MKLMFLQIIFMRWVKKHDGRLLHNLVKRRRAHVVLLSLSSLRSYHAPLTNYA